MTLQLTKETPIIFRKEASGQMTVTLNWSNARADVDLACIIENAKGGPENTTVVQALDKNFGSLQEPPFVSLSGDARNGGTETLTVNLAQSQHIKRAIVFAYIYSGGTWKQVGDASVTVHHPTQGDFAFSFSNKRARTCALVDLQGDGAGGLQLTRLEDYFTGFHQELDAHYRWLNINWTPGSKD